MYSYVNGPIGCFYMSHIVNIDTVNIGVQVYFQSIVFSR